uniref:Putative secreted protein n=1 Tax=Anopheles aquasalis TaxID=42839 RepID=T1E8B6_ANOAQ
MEVAWRFRIIFVMAFVVIIFGDLLGYGGARKEPKDKYPAHRHHRRGRDELGGNDDLWQRCTEYTATTDIPHQRSR